MLLQNLAPEEMEKYCKVWLEQGQADRKRIEEWFTKALKIKKGSPEAIMAIMQKRIQEMIQDIQFPYLVEAIRNKNFDIPLTEVGGDEATEKFLDQFTKTFGSPFEGNLPEEKKRILLEQIKAQKRLATGSLQEKSIRYLVDEINKAIEISEELQISYVDMLTNPENHKRYLRRRYTQEEYKNQSMNMIDEFISKMLQIVKMQLEQFGPHPNVSMQDPRYRKQQRKIEAQEKMVIWQTERRAKKLKKAFRKYAQQEIERLWGGRKRYWWSR